MIIFVEMVFKCCKIEYTVVDLPVPVAPVTRMIPFGFWIAFNTFSRLASENPKESIEATLSE